VVICPNPKLTAGESGTIMNSFIDTELIPMMIFRGNILSQPELELQRQLL
jgi:hypothetical protein